MTKTMEKRKFRIAKYLLELVTVFLGVTLAFALNTWNEQQNRVEAAEKTLLEIRNGLELDLIDLSENRRGHQQGVEICKYFRSYLNGGQVSYDTVAQYYRALLRDFVSIQNNSGYESLKSQGLELIENDTLRVEIISLYDFYYEIVEKLEENYSENQFNQNYFANINGLLAEYMVFDESGDLISINEPVNLTQKERNILLSYLWRIEYNRTFTAESYLLIEKKLESLIKHIDAELGRG